MIKPIGGDYFDNILIKKYDTYLRKNSKESRLRVWNKVKEFYIPIDDSDISD